MTPAPPRFSIVVTAFNEEQLVASAIESVLRQSEEDLELIVVDDGSTDGTVEVVREFASDPRLLLIEQENSGLSAARNVGIARARGELLAFLDSDDLLFPEYLRLMGAALDSRPDAGLAYTDAWLLDDDTDRFRRAGAMAGNRPPQDPPRDPTAFMRLLIESNFIFVSTTVRRAVLERVGGFDETLAACEDYDLWLRILGAGFGAVPGPGRLAIKRERVGAMTAQHRNMYVNLKRVCDSVAARPELDAEVRATATGRSERLAEEVALLDGSAGTASSLRAAVLNWARRTRARLRERTAWHPRTPAELSDAFPDQAWKRGWRPLSR